MGFNSAFKGLTKINFLIYDNPQAYTSLGVIICVFILISGVIQGRNTTGEILPSIE
jgi:hypothetical protein